MHFLGYQMSVGKIMILLGVSLTQRYTDILRRGMSDSRRRKLSERLGLPPSDVSLGELLDAVEKALDAKPPEVTQTMRGMACVVLEANELVNFCEASLLLAQEIWGEDKHLYFKSER